MNEYEWQVDLIYDKRIQYLCSVRLDSFMRDQDFFVLKASGMYSIHDLIKQWLQTKLQSLISRELRPYRRDILQVTAICDGLAALKHPKFETLGIAFDTTVSRLYFEFMDLYKTPDFGYNWTILENFTFSHERAEAST